MRDLLVLFSLACLSCSGPDNHHVYATNLRSPQTPQLMLWPADHRGKDFRYTVMTGQGVPLSEAPLLSERWPERHAFETLVLLLPASPSEQLLASGEELLAKLRANHPEASYHHIRQRWIDYPKIKRGRHLLAELGEHGGGAERFSGWFAVPFFWRLEGMAPRLLTVRESEGRVSWIHLFGSTTPREVTVGSLEEVLPPEWWLDPDDPYEFRGILFLEPAGCAPERHRELLEACLGQTRGFIVRAKTELWEYHDTQIGEEALAHLYPLDPAQFAVEPPEATTRVPLTPE